MTELEADIRAAVRKLCEHFGDGYWRQNQGIQFPLAQAADLMRFRAAELFDSHAPCGAEANMAKLLAAEYDIERKFRETRLYQVAPISTNLVLAYIAHNVLKLPRSY